MARYKEFDREDILEKAMKTFWQYGYEGTSIQILVKSTGIHRGSLYDTFGDKRSLFCEVLEYYNKTIVGSALERLEDPNSSWSDLVDFFNRIIEFSLSDRECKGCLLVNSAIEFCPNDSEISRSIRAQFKRIERAFFNTLNNAKNRGEIPKSRDVYTLAKYLTCSLKGLRVTAKIDPTRDSLERVQKSILATLQTQAIAP
ncbi:TetR family transcriptional regulator [Leptolyngbya valderiana BDU 20041]|nr:TetR/AcrR family transcriptional regulator [Geitlerinema sp. CS-897]OAB63035.1 TetR family transcriptional regulator [Leptolyngbya valderiana BDU 20041]PPT08675.1 Transcriptional regulator TetR family [Geitlerinema sp. FC II]